MAKKKTSTATTQKNGDSMAFTAATYADDKKAEDIVIMDMRGISPVTDYYVLCTATSLPHLRAVRNEIRDRFWLELNKKPVAADENMESLWIILHYGDVMVHIFHKDKRDFYALEELWGDAPRIPWTPPAPVTAKKSSGKKTAARKTTAKKSTAKKAAKSKS